MGWMGGCGLPSLPAWATVLLSLLMHFLSLLCHTGHTGRRSKGFSESLVCLPACLPACLLPPCSPAAQAAILRDMRDKNIVQLVGICMGSEEEGQPDEAMMVGRWAAAGATCGPLKNPLTLQTYTCCH